MTLVSSPQGSAGVNVGRPRLVPAATRVAALVLAAEGFLALGAAGYFLARWALGAQGVDVPVLLGSVTLFALAALGLFTLARGLTAGSTWPRTPAVLWHLLVAPIGWSVWEAAHPIIGGLVVASAVVGAFAVIIGARQS